MSNLGEMGEFGFIQYIRDRVNTPESVIKGIGDDCAVLRVGEQQLLISCDISTQDVHFRRGWPTHAIGYKAAAAALSDIAAMGGHAQWMLVSVSVPPVLEPEFLEEVMEGIQDAAGSAGAAIVGGDTTRSRTTLMFDIIVLGLPHQGRCLYRNGARPGDVLAVTGFPGVAAAGLHAVEHGQKAGTLIDRLWYPVPRLEEGRWLTERTAVHAMIDVSDGVVQDAGHIGEESGVGIALQSALIPVDDIMHRYADAAGQNPTTWSLSGGEDFELLVAIEEASFAGIQQEFQARFHLPLTRIGECTGEAGALTVDGAPPVSTGFDHFRDES
ncbi:MAG: thiamine-phosphate kinase [Candidatus Hydrogenedentes bacterium]|nr:thiamine-phosphate kinase [Candidatus Hydrogenedentota bacterium]